MPEMLVALACCEEWRETCERDNAGCLHRPSLDALPNWDIFEPLIISCSDSQIGTKLWCYPTNAGASDIFTVPSSASLRRFTFQIFLIIIVIALIISDII